MFLLQYVAKLIKILRKGAEPWQIAGGLVLGMIIGLTPFRSLHNLLPARAGEKVHVFDAEKTEIEKQKIKRGDKVKDALKGFF